SRSQALLGDAGREAPLPGWSGARSGASQPCVPKRSLGTRYWRAEKRTSNGGRAMAWEKTIPVSELADRPRGFKRPARQVALFRVGERVFAVDNRCPHEGYPLAEGQVDGACVLTCNWHNWKFRLEDGECLLGGDHVRAYPAKVEDGHV